MRRSGTFGLGPSGLIIVASIALFWAAVIVLVIPMLRWVSSGGIRDAVDKGDDNIGSRNAPNVTRAESSTNAMPEENSTVRIL